MKVRVRLQRAIQDDTFMQAASIVSILEREVVKRRIPNPGIRRALPIRP